MNKNGCRASKGAVLSAVIGLSGGFACADVVTLFSNTNNYNTGAANSSLGTPQNSGAYRFSQMGGAGTYFSLSSGVSAGTSPLFYGGFAVYDAEGSAINGTPAAISAADRFTTVMNVANEKAFGVALFDLTLGSGKSLAGLSATGTSLTAFDSGTFRWAVVQDGKLFVSQTTNSMVTATINFGLTNVSGTGWVEWSPLVHGATPGGSAVGNAGDIDFNDAYAGSYVASVNFASVTKVGFVYDVAEASATQQQFFVETFSAEVIPEPATLGLFSITGALVLLARRALTL